MKRAFDILVSLAALIILAPLMCVIALAIIVETGFPVLFRQERVGLNFQPFQILKFRSMRHCSAGAQITVSGDRRVTRVGKLLRLSKLDELPQFWNVLRGDMSLVGPRPEVPEYVALFKDRYSSILNVRPGITDLASIEFRNEEEVLRDCEDPLKAYVEQILPAKLDLADKYIQEQSIVGDCLIMLRTALRVI